ncbi:MAG: hypothetical protein ABSB79_10500 [Syntrophales bacterium]|jgi:hypothetical protein
MKTWVRNIFWLIGLGNLVTAGLAVCPFYDSSYFSSLNPGVFSSAGLIVIGLWGLVYIAVSNIYPKAPYVILVLVMEKLFYSYLAVPWMLQNGHRMGEIFQQDVIAGLAYCVWGPYDFLSFVFFLYVFLTVRKSSPALIRRPLNKYARGSSYVC